VSARRRDEKNTGHPFRVAVGPCCSFIQAAMAPASCGYNDMVIVLAETFDDDLSGEAAEPNRRTLGLR
jgi:hypothetical protein